MTKNDFTTDSRELFLWNYECWECGQNHWDVLHHILGRSSNSPLNAAPLNNFECHIGNGKLSHASKRSYYLQKTLEYLKKNNYKFTKKDKEFIEKNKKFYETKNND